MLKNILNIRHRYKGSFAAHILTLMTGTALAQSIPILASPILSRLYSPQDFGIFAVYMAIVSMVSLVATGRYELSIMLPDDEESAASIFVFSFLIVLSVSLATFILLLTFKGFLASFFDGRLAAVLLYLIPITVFFTGAYQLLNYWAIAKKKFSRLATNRVYQSGTATGFQLGSGLFTPGALGLVSGQVVGQCVGSGVLGWKTWKEDRDKLKSVTKENMICQAVRYKRFPLYSLLADFINTAANQVPNFLLSFFFGASTVGFFFLPQRVLGSPSSLIANSILDVFKERASRDYRTSGNCLDIYLKTFKHLLLISFLPFAALYFFTPVLIPFIFGAEWKIAGEYAQILSIMFFFRFVSSPLSYVLYIAERQNYDLIWQVFLFMFTVIAIGIGIYLNSAKISIACFALIYSAMYIVYLFLSYDAAKGNKRL